MPAIPEQLRPQSAAPFHRRRIAAFSNAAGAWARCERAACRRKGACKGANEIVPRCLPLVIDDSMESITECIAALPGAAPRPPSRAQEVTDALWDLQSRLAAIMGRMLDEMEPRKKDENR